MGQGIRHAGSRPRRPDIDTLKYYIVIMTLKGHLMSWCQIKECMFLSMNNCNYMSIGF